jgi:hypothetical protein
MHVRAKTTVPTSKPASNLTEQTPMSACAGAVRMGATSCAWLETPCAHLVSPTHQLPSRRRRPMFRRSTSASFIACWSTSCDQHLWFALVLVCCGLLGLNRVRSSAFINIRINPAMQVMNASIIRRTIIQTSENWKVAPLSPCTHGQTPVTRREVNGYKSQPSLLTWRHSALLAWWGLDSGCYEEEASPSSSGSSGGVIKAR